MSTSFLYKPKYTYMPYKITKNKAGSFKVTSPNGTRAKHTTLTKAKKQVRLLNAIEFGGFKPSRNKRK